MGRLSSRDFQTSSAAADSLISRMRRLARRPSFLAISIQAPKMLSIKYEQRAIEFPSQHMNHDANPDGQNSPRSRRSGLLRLPPQA